MIDSEINYNELFNAFFDNENSRTVIQAQNSKVVFISQALEKTLIQSNLSVHDLLRVSTGQHIYLAGQNFEISRVNKNGYIMTSILVKNVKEGIDPQFISIVKKTPIVYFQICLNSDGQITTEYISKNIDIIWGEKAQHSILKSYTSTLDFIHAEDRKQFTSNLINSLKLKSEWRDEFRIINSENKLEWVEVVGTFQEDISTSTKTKFIGHFYFITQRKNAEENLKNKIEQFESVAQAVDEAICEYDFQLGELFWSNGISRLFGYEKENMPTPENFKRYIHPLDFDYFHTQISARLNDTNVKKCHFKIRFKNFQGAYKHVLINSIILRGEHGEPLKIISAIKDITIQVNSNKLRRNLINKAIRDERKNISMELHDNIGQYLIAINLYLNRLKTNQDPETLAKCESLLLNCINRTRTLCYDLTPPELDQGILNAIRSLVTDLNSNSDISFQLKISQSITKDHFANIDEYQSYRIIQEFINNSIKHSKCSSILIKAYETKGFIYFEIHDNGVGFELNEFKKYGLGIRNMIERAELANAMLCYNSSIEGTSITLKLMEIYNH